ncbi:MAG: DUF2059 domain-containing protein [Verrucomicrobiota bacterium]
MKLNPIPLVLPRSVSLAVAGLLSVSGIALAAPDPASSQSTIAAERLVQAMDYDDQVAAQMASLNQFTEQMLDAQGLSPDEKLRALEQMEVVMDEVKDIVAPETMISLFVRVHSDLFSAEELNALADFFESPAGRPFVERQNELQQAIMTETSRLMMEVMPRIQAASTAAAAKARNGKAD